MLEELSYVEKPTKQDGTKKEENQEIHITIKKLQDEWRWLASGGANSLQEIIERPLNTES